MRRAIVALLVGGIAAGALLWLARESGDGARARARRAADDVADARAEVAGGAIDAWRARAATDPDPDASFAALVRGIGAEAVPAGTPVDERAGIVPRHVRTVSVGGHATDVVVHAAYTLPSPEPTRTMLALAGALALALALFAFFGMGAGGRDRTLEAAARRVGEGDLDVTLDGSNPTASAFNRMTRELRDARTRLARAERIAAWRDIARRIAHEIKNPLTPIKMAMETLRKTHARKHPDFDEIFEESTKTVLEETARLERIVTEFSRFARMPRPKAESMDVVEVAERVVSMHDLPAAAATLPEAAKGVRVELATEIGRMPSVRADREQLVQVLVNVVQNACDAAREKQGDTGGRVVVKVGRAENDGVRIVVSDNGPGIPDDARAAVLEPYYTTKSHGTGLGLAIVDRIVSDHGGSVTLGDSSELGGAEITIVLRREGPSDEPESSVGV
jgi:nitrogen fixation/metabolism regulation signal transduction histidine kinase